MRGGASLRIVHGSITVETETSFFCCCSSLPLFPASSHSFAPIVGGEEVCMSVDGEEEEEGSVPLLAAAARGANHGIELGC